MDFEGFMYLDVENPLVAWNTYRGVLVSQKLVKQRVKDPFTAFLSMTAANFFMNRNWPRLSFEYELEGVRVREFPTSVSRLQCIFVFDDVHSALAAASDESWGGHISHEYLSDVGVSDSPSSTRVDANWVSWMLRSYHGGQDNWRDGIRPYWMGHICPHFSHPIWEILLDGSVTIWGTALRSRAYEVTKQRSPSCVSLLEQSRLAASLGSDLGHVTALVITDGRKQRMSFYIDMRDGHNETFTDRRAAYVANNPDSVNFRDLAVGGDKFTTPNFLLYSYEFGS